MVIELAKIIRVEDGCVKCPYYVYHPQIVMDMKLRYYCRESRIGAYKDKILLEHCPLEEEKKVEGEWIELSKPVDSPNSYPITKDNLKGSYNGERDIFKVGSFEFTKFGNDMYARIDGVKWFKVDLDDIIRMGEHPPKEVRKPFREFPVL